MDDLQREINAFTNQVVGHKVVSYDGKYTPMAADIIREREEEEKRNNRKDIVHILNGQTEDTDR